MLLRVLLQVGPGAAPAPEPRTGVLRASLPASTHYIRGLLRSILRNPATYTHPPNHQAGRVNRYRATHIHQCQASSTHVQFQPPHYYSVTRYIRGYRHRGLAGAERAKQRVCFAHSGDGAAQAPGGLHRHPTSAARGDLLSRACRRAAPPARMRRPRAGEGARRLGRRQGQGLDLIQPQRAPAGPQQGLLPRPPAHDDVPRPLPWLACHACKPRRPAGMRPSVGAAKRFRCRPCRAPDEPCPVLRALVPGLLGRPRLGPPFGGICP